MSKRDIIYLDHAAATPLDETVRAAMEPYFADCFYNPSASYEEGRQARQALEEAREKIARMLGAKPFDIVFTAGATESINLALHGFARRGAHTVIGATEHDAVRAAVGSKVSFAKADGKGFVTASAVADAVNDETEVVSVCLADNELGTIQPTSDIAHALERIKSDRLLRGVTTPLYFHADGSQAAGALDLSVSRLGIDMLTLNASKCYGPKQVGLLFVQSSVRLEPLMAGGGQERGLRSGTENIAGAVGFAVALEKAQAHRHDEGKRLAELRDTLQRGLEEKIDGLVVNGSQKKRLPGHLNVSLPGLDAERVVYRLDEAGVLVATGAACAANKGTRSKTLEAIGLAPEVADGSLRLTLGALNNSAQIEHAGRLIAEAMCEERRL